MWTQKQHRHWIFRPCKPSNCRTRGMAKAVLVNLASTWNQVPSIWLMNKGLNTVTKEQLLFYIHLLKVQQAHHKTKDKTTSTEARKLWSTPLEGGSDPEFIRDVSVLQTTDGQLSACCNYKFKRINLTWIWLNAIIKVTQMALIKNKTKIRLKGKWRVSSTSSREIPDRFKHNLISKASCFFLWSWVSWTKIPWLTITLGGMLL